MWINVRAVFLNRWHQPHSEAIDMRKPGLSIIVAVSSMLLMAGGYALAEEHETHHPGKPPAEAAGQGPSREMPGGGMQRGMMMGGDMMRGMMGEGMMGCPMMQRQLVIPELPPGNARLQLQMQAEIMQKVGEILAKYADQVKEGQPQP